MTLVVPLWVYGFVFGYTAWLHFIMKRKVFPDVDKKRILLQSLVIGAIIAGFSFILSIK